MSFGDSKRAVRIGKRIRSDLAQVLARDINDPALSLVTIFRVHVTDDLKLACVYYRLMVADDADVARLRKEVARGFRRAAGTIRGLLGRSLSLRSTPVLEFHYDENVDHVRKVEAIIDDIAARRARRDDLAGTSERADDEQPDGA